MLNPYLEKTLFSLPVQPILIELDPGKFADTLSQVDGLFGMAGFLAKPYLEALPTFSLAALSPVGPETIRKINALPGVRMVHANLQVRAIQLPNQPADWWPTSESRKVLEADRAFMQGYTGEFVKVGVTDTGVDALHEQLLGTEHYSTISWPAREVVDENGHGTHVASTLAGRPYQSLAEIPVEGVSRARLVAVKCLGRGIGTGFTSEILNAMTVCWEKGSQVISMSLGVETVQGGVENDPMCRMVSTLTQKGMMVVVAAGNSGPDDNTIGSPAASPDAITVAAVGKDLTVAKFSSRGGDRFPGKPDVAAPGVMIYSGTSKASPMSVEQPQAGFGYIAISGTSMATPHVSGLIAMLKQKYPGLTTAQFKAIMQSKGQPWNKNTGWGIPRWSMFS